MNQSNTHRRAATRIAFIQSSWHKDIVDQGRESFLAQIAELGVARNQIDLVTVPGAFEIPLHAKLLARSERYDGIVACGFVVDGGIYRHEFVADAVISGLMQVQLATEVPVFSMVLTPHHFHEHTDHREFFLKHFVAKGIEAARACHSTLQSLDELRKTVTTMAAIQ
jgi:6,7-dimethyl-8-ribityllumazine synthase